MVILSEDEEMKNKSVLHQDFGEVLKKRYHISVFNLLLIIVTIFVAAFFAGNQTAGVFQLSPKAFFRVGGGTQQGGVSVFTPPTPTDTSKICQKCGTDFKCTTGEKILSSDSCSEFEPGTCTDSLCEATATNAALNPTVTPDPKTKECYRCYKGACDSVTVAKNRSCPAPYTNTGTCNESQCKVNATLTPVPPTPTDIKDPSQCDDPGVDCQEVNKKVYYKNGFGNCDMKCETVKVVVSGGNVPSDECTVDKPDVACPGGSNTPPTATKNPNAPSATKAPTAAPAQGSGKCTAKDAACTDDYPCTPEGLGCTTTCHKKGVCSGPGGGTQCSWGPGSYWDPCNTAPTSSSGNTGGTPNGGTCSGNGQCQSGSCNTYGSCEADCANDGEYAQEHGGHCCAGTQTSGGSGLCSGNISGGNGPGGSCPGDCATSAQNCRNLGGNPSGSGGCPAGVCCN